MDKIYIAKIGRAVGLKGQQKLIIDTDFPEQFKKNKKLITDKNQELIIQTYNPTNNVVKFFGIDSVEDAKKLTNRELFVSSEDTRDSCSLGEKQFFWFDIIDCIIKENDEILGKVSDIQRMPLSDYLMIKTDSQLIKKGFATSFLVPYLDTYILFVDIEKKLIITQNTKDLLEAS
ncbi:MAG: 16S rRNA processing protein RimM [Arcobacter sp.]|nr:MAG: 16S rRNA processing protein RimM [Arcobacter sp.]